MESEEESAGEKGRRAANWRCPESLGLASGPGARSLPSAGHRRWCGGGGERRPTFVVCIDAASNLPIPPWLALLARNCARHVNRGGLPGWVDGAGPGWWRRGGGARPGQLGPVPAIAGDGRNLEVNAGGSKAARRSLTSVFIWTHVT
ncbi:hypothetical protein Purlil1_2655 [Purpureocillium lilacinum]|uniref:Uncharacterized protein n=1 Tax=Purpureocillium lilacinum TaxID=33203 RepID=A0ABR0C954_PURLI|nr:hypothetical protein Purlil1_2655 [Purpureocillium lilacinum]